ncbi:hypothetical protein [Martelella endophytica]|uniref:Uncharacterized protein n=1 Tax=Martelella endophytica TaxID=1486262 RepID=A0A0D5LSW4_MAREN|nr:hypothetical protein [Martelella endophytica]AJY47055.1 hypothetical protein TM49_17430 [Martelella endophytica]
MRKALEPANERQSDIMLDALMDRGFAIPDSVNAEKAGQFYAEVMRGKPIGALRRVFENLRLGRYPKFQSFLPKPAELSALVDDAARHDRDLLRIEHDKAEAARERQAERAHRNIDPAERERRRRKVAAVNAMLGKALGAHSGGGDD